MFKKIQAVVIFVGLLVLVMYYYTDSQGLTIREIFRIDTSIVRIGDVPIDVEIANDSASRTKGLSGRDSMSPIQGLLFVFDESDYYGVWMKDMNFPIDVIWIDEDFKVVGITEALLPESYPQVFEPPVPIRYFIETARYFPESFGIKVGDEVVVPENLLK